MAISIFYNPALEKLKVLSAATFLLFSSCNSLKSNFTAHKARKQLAVLIMSMLYSSKINSAPKQHQVIAYLSSCNQTCYLLFSYCKINCNYEFIKPLMHIYYTYYNLAIAISLPKYYCDSGVRVCWNGECMVRVSMEAFKDRIQAQIRIIQEHEHW